MKDTKAHPLRVARLSLSRPLTQQQLADFAEVSISTIERAERGDPIRVDCQQRICAYLNKTPQELGLQMIGKRREKRDSSKISYTDDQETVSAHDLESRDDVNRRQALQKIVTTGTLLTTPHELFTPQPWERLSNALTEPAHFDESTLNQFDKLTEVCWHLTNGRELGTVEHILPTYLPRLVKLAQQPSEAQQSIASIAARGILIASTLAGHRNDLNARQQYSEQAFLYGQIAKDVNLQVSALKQLAGTFDYKKRPAKALEVYQQASQYTNNVSPLLRARIYAGLAGSYAQCAQRQAALTSLSLAHEYFPAKPEDDPNFLHADCGYFTLLLYDGLTHLDLNEPQEALKTFALVDGLSPKIPLPERVRLEFLNYQATAFLELRDLEQSSTYLEAAVKGALTLGSESRYNEALDVYQQMRIIWRHEPQVKALADMFVR